MIKFLDCLDIMKIEDNKKGNYYEKLFLVDGAAGLVKSDLIQFIYSRENSIIVTKYSTRAE